MSIQAVDGAVNAVDDYDLKTFFFKDVPSTRQFHVLQIPQVGLEIVHKIAGVGEAALAPITQGLGKIVSLEDIVFFVQDLAALPSHVSKLREKVSGYRAGNTQALELVHQVRKCVAHVFSTIGDYAGSIAALKGLNIAVSQTFDFVSDKVRNVSSLLGASSRFYDYMRGDLEYKSDGLSPTLNNVRRPLEESKHFWDACMNVSIVALSALGLTYGAPAAAPVMFTLGTASLLGSRLVSFYRSCQMKAVDESHRT